MRAAFIFICGLVAVAATRSYGRGMALNARLRHRVANFEKVATMSQALEGKGGSDPPAETCDSPHAFTCPPADKCVPDVVHTTSSDEALANGLKAAGQVAGVVGKILAQVLKSSNPWGSIAASLGGSVLSGIFNIGGNEVSKCDDVCIWNKISKFVNELVDEKIDAAIISSLQGVLNGTREAIKSVDRIWRESPNYPNGAPPDRYWSNLDNLATVLMPEQMGQFLQPMAPERSTLYMAQYATTHIALLSALLGGPPEYADKATQDSLIHKIDNYVNHTTKAVADAKENRLKLISNVTFDSGVHTNHGCDPPPAHGVDNWKCKWTLEATWGFCTMGHCEDTGTGSRPGSVVCEWKFTECDNRKAEVQQCMDTRKAYVSKQLDDLWKGTLDAVEQWKTIKAQVQGKTFPKFVAATSADPLA